MAKSGSKPPSKRPADKGSLTELTNDEQEVLNELTKILATVKQIDSDLERSLKLISKKQNTDNPVMYSSMKQSIESITSLLGSLGVNK